LGIYDERRLAELRYKQSRNRSLFRAVGYVTSLIPAILIALNFDSFRSYVLGAFGGVPIETIQQQPVQQPPPRIVRDRPSRQQTEPQVRVSHATLRKSTPRNVTPPPFFDDEQLPAKPRQPVQLLPPKHDSPRQQTKPNYVIALDLSEKIQRFPLRSLTPEEALTIRTTFAGITHLAPGEPGRIDLHGPYNPRIEFSIEVRSETILVLEYLVDSEQGKSIPLTSPNLGSIRRRIMRKGERAMAILKTLQAEKLHLDAYLASSQAKLWTEKRAAEMRVKKLPRLIEAAQAPVNQLADELSTVDRLIDMVESVHGSTVDVFIDLPTAQQP